jgi:lipopolysaccharide assembly outer membrane protein LptD (OstA)
VREERLVRGGLTVILMLLLVAWPAAAQFAAPADMLEVRAASARTWMEEQTSVVLLEGPVAIDLDRNHLSASSAVLWITTLRQAVGQPQRVEIALVGEARLEQPNGVVRSGPRLFVDARVRGRVRLLAGQRTGGEDSASELYRTARELRPVLLPGTDGGGRWLVEEPALERPVTTQPTDRFRPLEPVSLATDHFETTLTPEGRVAAILTGKVILIQRQRSGDLLELLADRAVVFTPFGDLGDLVGAERIRKVEQAVTGVYLEGDVRIIRTPANARRDAEQRLEANRAFYDFTTDRAILTEVVLHTTDPRSGIPIIVRADAVRQLSLNEYSAEKALVTTSSFATPSFAIGASSTYLRQTEIGNAVTGTRTSFVARNATFDLWGVPVFYLPAVAGSVTERNALRNVEIGNSGDFGLGIRTEWGLFETLGRLPPRGTDMSFHLDYYSDRGPAVGFDGSYVGGWLDNNTRAPTSYSGDFTSYLVYDRGEDDLGRRRRDVEPDDELRGRLFWRHQHFLDDWQIQLTGAYLSDPTFLESWFRREFRNESPQDTSFYAKYQKGSEAFTFLLSLQPNRFATTAGVYQEQAEIQRLPEITYRRIGESLWGDSLTLFSENSLSVLQFRNSDYTLEELGFAPAPVGRQSPGLPSYGQTGTPEDTTWRGDFRQEVNWPMTVWRFKAVPYVLGRYSAWSESVEGGGTDRLYAGGGLRLTTAYWKVDNYAASELLDIHRLRHVVEPMVNIYVAASSRDTSSLLIYDEPVENINDAGAVQVALLNRWQTKRGGPGRWRSVDVLTLNLQGNFFFNQPEEREIQPTDFRGLYFVANPETSIPRNSFNAQYEWRVSDAVSLPGDVQFNLDEGTLATASIGVSVRQDERLSYYVGLRHIGLDFEQVVNGNTFTFDRQDLLLLAGNYQLTTNYRLGLALGYDLAQSRTERAVLSLARRFDRFFVEIAFRLDQFQGDNAVFFNIWPEGLQPAGGTSSLSPGLMR